MEQPAPPTPETPPSGTEGQGTTPQVTPPSTPPEFDWKSQIPEPLRGEKVWESIPDFSTLAKRFVDNHKYNTGALKLPPKGAHPSAWDDVYSRLGRPESPDKYEVAAPAMPEGVTWDENNDKAFKEEAHKLGLSSQQLQGVLNWYGDFVARGYEQMQQQTRSSADEALEALQAEFGPTTYERHLNTVQAFIRAESDPELWEELERTGWGNHPQLTRLLMRIADDWKSDQIAGGMKEEDFTGMPSPQAAMEEAKKIMADMKGPYWDRGHPLWKETTEKVRRLMEMASS